MTINVNTSEKNKETVTDLTNKLRLGPENNIARLAFVYSIAQNRKMQLSDIQDSKGKSYKEVTFFGRHKAFYVALVCQHYDIYKSDEDVPKYIKMHVDDGLEMIHLLFSNNPRLNGMQFLIDNIERGVEAIANSELPDVVNNPNQLISDNGFYEGPIHITVGHNPETKEPIVLRLNSIDYNNNHIAVAGSTGTGKTRFALDFLEQLVSETGGAVCFSYLDFKGLKQDDLVYMDPYFKRTNTTFIDAPHTPFPINPLTFIDNVNRTNKLLGISKFVNIISQYAKLGKNQEQTLKDATREVFDRQKMGTYPSLQDVFQEVVGITDGKPSKLREIMDSMGGEIEMFQKDPNPDFLKNNYYFSLSGDLPNEVRFTAVFLIINYIYNTFMNMANVPVGDEYKGMRYVLLIDEAHVIFKDKKAQALLESLLREIRSKGVSVFLLSQGIREFIQPEFTFSDMCEMGFLLDIKDKDPKLIQKFLGYSSNQLTKISRNMEQIKKGQALSNLLDHDSDIVFNLSQVS